MNKKVVCFLALFVSMFSVVRSQYLNWAFPISSTGYDEIVSMSSDYAGNVYAIGQYSAVCDFDPGPGTYNLTPPSSYHTFITKYNASGDLIWAKQLGLNSGGNTPNSIVTDSVGNSYITGEFSGTVDFNPGSGTFNMSTAAFNYQTFILKLDPAGNFIWAKQISPRSSGQSITISEDNFLYITGSFTATADLDPGLATYNLVSAGQEDMYLLKLNTLGNFVWAKRFGGGYWDVATEVTTDIDGNIYTTGYFGDTADFGPVTKIAAGQHDMCITKFSSSGNFEWTSTIGGDFEDRVLAIDVDENGLIYLEGSFEDVVDFDPDSAGVFNLTSFGNNDLCVVKLDSSGSLIWAKQFGGFYNDGIGDMQLDDSCNIYSVGYFNETADFDPGPGTQNLLSFAFSDAYITKWDSSGGFIWVKQIGGNQYNGISSLMLNGSNNIYIAGGFTSTVDFDPNVGTYSLTSMGNTDGFIALMGDPPPPSANFSGPTSICAGDTAQFTNTTTLGPATYLWTFPGGSPSSSTNTNPLVVYNTPGTYNVTLIATNINGSDTLSFPNYIAVNPLPVAPVITHVYPNLHSSSSTGNQWYFNGTLIPGATGQNHIPTSNGNYTVEFTNGSGCSSMSAPYSFTTLGDNPASEIEKLVIYPNPASDLLQVVTTTTTGNAEFKITDLSGKICLTGQLTGSIDISHLNSGVYLIEVIIGNSAYRGKWIKD